jgi:predicted O-methyltransferase YrrM
VTGERIVSDPPVRSRPYDFSVDWFSHNIPRWTTHLSELAGKPNLRFVEIGSFEGRSAVWLLENVLTHDTAQLWCVETFGQNPDGPDTGFDFAEVKRRFLENVAAAAPSGKVTLIEGPSHLALRELPAATFDFVYVDGSHLAYAVLQDAVLSFLLLRNGGIMFFDDYFYEGYRGVAPEVERPRLAINAFLEVFEGRYELLARESQVVIRRRR